MLCASSSKPAFILSVFREALGKSHRHGEVTGPLQEQWGSRVPTWEVPPAAGGCQGLSPGGTEPGCLSPGRQACWGQQHTKSPLRVGAKASGYLSQGSCQKGSSCRLSSGIKSTWGLRAKGFHRTDAESSTRVYLNQRSEGNLHSPTAGGERAAWVRSRPCIKHVR